MIIATTYLNGEIFQHFGQTPAFKIYKIQEGQIVSEHILETNGTGHGALIGFLTNESVTVLICGGIGPGAQEGLKASGIQVYGGVSGNADAQIHAFLENRLVFNPNASCSHNDHNSKGHAHHCGHGGCHH